MYAPVVRTWRTVHFWQLASRMIMDYKLMANKREPNWDSLHDIYAPRVLELAIKLRGLYVKLGQQASTMPVVPKQFRDKLEMLQKGVPPKPTGEVRAIIEKSLGKKFPELFSWFDDNCIGSASVGQVLLFVPLVLGVRVGQGGPSGTGCQSGAEEL